jgi:gamma-glutamyltranspeptidase/glutathione hydrolase
MHLRTRFHLAALVAAVSLAACGGGDSPPVAVAAPAPVPAPPAPQAIDRSCEVVSNTGSVVVGSGLAGDPAAPEPASGYRTGYSAVNAKTYMVVANNPLASSAGCAVLKAGGTAADAAVAVQMVLGLVEPQSSGLGGGAFMLYYDAATKTVQSYDGRETAPAAATENYLRYIDDATNQGAPLPNARASGRSIGVPGAVRMLEVAHKEHGKLAWKDLFTDGIRLATLGFYVPGRMADAVAGARTNLQRDADAAAAYLNADGSSKATVGSILKLPAYAATLTAIANGGADAFYTGDIARSIVDKANVTSSADNTTAITPARMTLADLANYRAKKRTPVCTTYRANYVVCGMGPPSSGGIAVAQSLGILENFNLAQYAPTAVDLEGGKPQVLGVHLVSEAERLAYADRDKYVADTDFQPLPGNSVETMVNKPYLKSRASLISMTKSMGVAEPGNLGPVPAAVVPVPEGGTTHFSIVDKYGNALAMTTTVESSFGSYHMTRGFILNNQLTDFSAVPSVNGVAVANRVQPGKRPRSSMAPTLVFRQGANGSLGDFVMATGSPGGATIIQYVVKTVVGVLDWNLDAQQATSMIDFGAANSATTSVGGEHPNVNIANGGNNDPLVSGLRALGHTVSTNAQSSGISTIVRAPLSAPTMLQGGADPRREGLVLGDTFK